MESDKRVLHIAYYSSPIYDLWLFIMNIRSKLSNAGENQHKQKQKVAVCDLAPNMLITATVTMETGS